MIRTLFFTLFFAIVATFLSTYFYLGAYKDAEIYITETPPIFLVYKEHVGAYHQTSFIIEQVEKTLKEVGISCKKTFGLFIDSPDEVVETDLRFWAGCAFEEFNQKKLPKGIQLARIQKQVKTLQANFNGSPTLGPIRVYEPAKKWLQDGESLFPSLEFYTFTNDGKLETHYLFSIPMPTPMN